MKITLIISSLSIGGAERVLTVIANYLVDCGHQVTIITLDAKTAKPFFPLSDEISLRQIDMLSHNTDGYFKRLCSIFIRCYKLRKAIIKTMPDVILSFMDIMNITTLLAMYGVNIPIIVSERSDPHHHKIPRFYNWLRNKLYHDSYRVIVQTNDALEYFPSTKNTQIIPNPNRFFITYDREIKLHPDTIISLGRLDQAKDHETLIKAMPLVISKYPKLILNIYGNGPLQERLQHLIDSLGLEKNIYLKGIKKDIQESLEDADLFVLPSLYEGFPNSLLEAMAVGTPSIASNCSGSNTIIDHNINGLLFDIGDVDALSNAILQLLDNHHLRKKLSCAAMNVAQLYDAKIILPKWEALLTQAANGVAIDYDD